MYYDSTMELNNPGTLKKLIMYLVFTLGFIFVYSLAALLTYLIYRISGLFLSDAPHLTFMAIGVVIIIITLHLSIIRKLFRIFFPNIRNIEYESNTLIINDQEMEVKNIESNKFIVNYVKIVAQAEGADIAETLFIIDYHDVIMDGIVAEEI